MDIIKKFLNKTPQYCYDHFRLCSVHFEDRMFSGMSKNRLKRDAIPTLFEREPLYGRSEENISSSSITFPHETCVTGTNKTLSPSTDENYEFETLEEGKSHNYTLDECIQWGHSRTMSSPVSTQTPIATKEMSLESEKLKRRVKILQNRNNYLENKLKTIAAKPQVVDSPREIFDQLTDKFLPPKLSVFVKLQADLVYRQDKGLRYTDDFKRLCLFLYFRGPKAYRALSELFVLPTKRTLSRYTEMYTFLPGINKASFDILKEKINNYKDIDKVCILTIDEMALKAHLFCNISTDTVIGCNVIFTDRDYTAIHEQNSLRYICGYMKVLN